MSQLSHDRVRLTIDVDVASEPIRGSLRSAGAAAIEFVGWLELMSALEAACAQPGPAPSCADR